MSRMRKFLLITVLFLNTHLTSQTTVAVLDFETEGLGNVPASALSAIVRREVLKSSDYRLIERKAMDEILQEQGFQQTGCVSSECAVEVGKLLGVQKMVSGSISGLGSLFLLDIQMIDVATGEIEKTSSVEHMGKIEELVSPLREAANAMLSGIEQKNDEAFLYAESNPSGAQISLDGQFVGSAPLKYPIQPRKYRVLLKAQGYSDWSQEITGKLGETVLVKAELLEIKASSAAVTSSEGGIGKWEVLGITRDEYVEFLRLGILERDWLDKFQPAGASVGELSEYKALGIPDIFWINFKKAGISLNEMNEYKAIGIEHNYWVAVKESEIPPKAAFELITSGFPPTLWNEMFNVQTQYGISANEAPKFVETITIIANLINDNLINETEYGAFKNDLGIDHKKFFTDVSGNSITDNEIDHLSKTLNNKKLNKNTMRSVLLNWKQSLFNTWKQTDGRDQGNMTDIIMQRTVWEWLVVQIFDISNEKFLDNILSDA